MPENRFGRRLELIDQVKIVCDKNIGFVHFLSISTTIKVVNTLRTEPPWADKHVNYGKDRCAYIPKSQQTATQAAQAAAAGADGVIVGSRLVRAAAEADDPAAAVRELVKGFTAALAA